MLRVLSELFGALRREGLAISTSQSIDAARIVGLVGWEDRGRLFTSLESALVTRTADRPIFRKGFDDFFRQDRGHPGDLFERLRGRGVTASEIDVLRELLAGVSHRSGQSADRDAVSLLQGSPSDLEWLLRGARMQRVLAGMTSPKMAGAFARRASSAMGVDRAANVVDRIGAVLEEALGEERGRLATLALREELDAMKRRIRLEVERQVTPRDEEDDARKASALDRPFAELDPDEAVHVERAVRRLAEKLRGGARVRTRRARRGRIDTRTTMRRAMRTFGVPIRLYFKKPRDDRSRLVVVCDVSDSVRTASRFMLELVAMTSTLFERTRSFVFVSDLVETTSLFASEPNKTAMRALSSGAVVDLGGASHYERALLQAERVFGASLDKRTTLVILGDGRTNHRPDGAEAIARMKDRCRAVVWVCPESAEQWGLGDSRMNRYREVCTTVLPARTARELEEAARKLTRLR